MFRCTAALFVVVAMLSGCSSEKSDSGPGGNTPTGFAMPKGAWLLALEVDGKNRQPLDETQRVYMAFHPETGQTAYRVIPPETEERGVTDTHGAGASAGKDVELQVSADYQRAVRAVGTSQSERKSGVVTTYSLSTGQAQQLDLRQLTGDIRVQPRRVVFDPKNPGLLRVLTADRKIWTIDVDKRTATQAGSTDLDPEGAAFDLMTGDVRISPTGDRTIPGGVALASRQGYPKLPGKTAEYVKTDDGTVWAFAIEGGDRLAAQELRAYKLSPGTSDWVLLPAKPAPPLISGMPAIVEINDINWVRPPLR